MISRRQVAALAIAGPLVAACARHDEEDNPADSATIRFAVYSPDPGSALADAWRPIIAEMEASTGLKTRLSPVAGASALVEAMRQRKIDLGLFSNQSALGAVRRAGGEVFARAVAASGGGDVSILMVNAKSKLTLEGVLKCDHSQTLGLGEALSTSASLAPETYLFAPRGLLPAKCFRSLRRDSPEANLGLVAAGRLDLATIGADRLKQLYTRAPWLSGAVREIWRSPPLPESPLVWRRDLDPAIKEKLRQFFLTYGEGDTGQAAAQRRKLAALGVGGFMAADDSHLLPQREMEATHVWMDAQQSGDKARIGRARAALEAVTAERLDLEARTRAPAAAQ